MDENNINVNDDEELDDDLLENILVLTEEDGTETEFQYLDQVELDGKTYMILLPLDSADDGEVVIFRIEGEDGDETFIGVETEEEASRVFEVFKEQAKDDFNFVD